MHKTAIIMPSLTTCGTVSVGGWPSKIGEDTVLDVDFGEGVDFGEIPRVVVMLAGVDAHSPKAKRIGTWVSDITPQRFRLHVSSWADSITWNVKVTWIATTDAHAVQFGTQELGKCPDHQISGDELRTISFSSTLACTPDSVAVGIAGMDASGDTDLRLWTEGNEANCRDFSLRCSSWDGSVTWGASVAFVASASPAALQTGSLELGDGRSGEAICAGSDHFHEIRFPRAFGSIPRVAIAVSGIDADSSKPLRVDTWADEVREDGFRLHVRSWEDSVTHRVRLSWFATPSYGASAPSSSSSVAVPPWQPPVDYVVEGTLGEGCWGVTHRARHAGDGRQYAIKTCKQSYRRNEEALRAELQNLARLPIHPNLLRYHACMIQADHLHIITEYLDAFRILDLIPSPDGPFKCKQPIASVLRWAAQLFDGLAEMHKVGMLHRDLHGENILIERDADGSPSQGHRAVRIIDFGVSKIYDIVKPRQMSNLAGCWQYFSPERRKGDAFDDRDDVWAVGCHLTELASGRSIRNRKGSGLDGIDFALSPAVIAEAITECGSHNSHCRNLAKAVLVTERSKRPCAAQARDSILGKMLAYCPGKRSAPSTRTESGCGPSGGGRIRGPPSSSKRC